MPQPYSTFEDIAHRFFSDAKSAFGFSEVERDVVLPSSSGNTYRIEVLGRRNRDDGDIIIECRHYGPHTNISQEDVGALGYRVQNTNTAGAFIVTTHGLQSGAQKIADFEQISVFLIGHDATVDDHGVVREITAGLSRFFLKIGAEQRQAVSVGKTVIRRDLAGNVIGTEEYPPE